MYWIYNKLWLCVLQMILFYIFKGENAEKYFNIDYIQFHFKICYLLYFKPDRPKFERFLDDLKRELDHKKSIFSK